MLLAGQTGVKAPVSLAGANLEFLSHHMSLCSSSIPSLRFFAVSDELEVNIQRLEHHVHGE
jgi:hypothetical protein